MFLILKGFLTTKFKKYSSRKKSKVSIAISIKLREKYQLWNSPFNKHSILERERKDGIKVIKSRSHFWNGNFYAKKGNYFLETLFSSFFIVRIQSLEWVLSLPLMTHSKNCYLQNRKDSIVSLYIDAVAIWCIITF